MSTLESVQENINTATNDLIKTEKNGEVAEPESTVDNQQQQQSSQIEPNEIKIEKNKADNDDKCPVCLQKFFNSKSKSFASSCFHSFCFECLLEWTKIKHNCPLCKRAFDRIVYDIKSRLEFKEFYLKPRDTSNLMQAPLEIIAVYPNNALLPVNTNVNLNRPIETVSRASWHINQDPSPIEFRMMVYQNQWHVNPCMTQVEYKIKNIESEFSDIDLTNGPVLIDESDTFMTNSYRPVRSYRNINSEWFRDNPAGAHRLIRFIDRDLQALSFLMQQQNPLASNKRLSSLVRSRIINDIIQNVKIYPLDSEEFLRDISIDLRPMKYARLFQHELVSFAKSATFSLEEYDAKCVYYSDKYSMPNSLRSSTNQTIPFECIPVNLSKYRLSPKPNNQRPNHIDQIEIIPLPDTPTMVTLIESGSESDVSSYCEEIPPSPKKTPPCIVLSSPSPSPTNSLTEESQPFSNNAQKLKKKRKHKHRKHKKSKKSKHRSHSRERKEPERRKSRHKSRGRSRSRVRGRSTSISSTNVNCSRSTSKSSRSSTRSSSRQCEIDAQSVSQV